MNGKKIYGFLEEMVNEAEKKNSVGVLRLNEKIEKELSETDPLSRLYIEIDNIRIGCISAVGILIGINEKLIRDTRKRLYRIQNKITAIYPSCKRQADFYPIGSITKQGKEIEGMQFYDCGECETTLSLAYLKKT